jgi:hypothetical protein
MGVFKVPGNDQGVLSTEEDSVVRGIDIPRLDAEERKDKGTREEQDKGEYAMLLFHLLVKTAGAPRPANEKTSDTLGTNEGVIDRAFTGRCPYPSPCNPNLRELASRWRVRSRNLGQEGNLTRSSFLRSDFHLLGDHPP